MAEILEEQQGEKESRILPRDIEEEMKSSYIDYAMSVIVGRALPDVRDGLKPVHRRILYTMKEMGLFPRASYKKSARVVGEVLGKYHPHGDAAVYDALVRMAQDFSLRMPLIDGQGNFGSIDGDPPAAMRYTEARLERVAEELIADIDKEVVDFVPNYDGSLQEPTVLPAGLPNLLVNGSSGIAVGMATNIPPHNLEEIIDALVACIENPKIEIKELEKIVKGPDFPGGGIVLGREGIKDYFSTGRGTIRIQSRVEEEELKGGKKAIIIRELPYQVNKANLLMDIARLVKEKKINDISDVRDESDREGIRIVIEIKKDGNLQVVLNQLFKHTQLETKFGVIMLALVNNRPEVLDLRRMLFEYLKHREIVVRRRVKYDLAKADQRAHILEGLKIALDNLNKIIKLIREAKTPQEASERLTKEFSLSKIQAQAILDMRLHQLTGLERKKIEEEYLELIKTIERLRSILADPRKLMNVIKEEFLKLKEKYPQKRLTKIIKKAREELDIEDLIKEEDVAVTISHAGYVKRLPLSTYQAQRRGGRGKIGATTREEDFIENLFITSTHAYMLFFTDRGKVFWLKVYEIPEAGRQAKGKAIVNLISLEPGEKITAALPIRSFAEEKETFLLMATRKGMIKKTPLEAYSRPRRTGIVAIGLKEGDTLIGVEHTDGEEEVVLATRKGMAIRFSEKEVRPSGRASQGVRGIKLGKDDWVVGMEVVKGDDLLLTVTEKGYGKRTQLDKYRLQSRGGRGVKNIQISERNGLVVGIAKVNQEEIVLISAQGMTIRLRAPSISIIGRATQGVRLFRLAPDDRISSLARVVEKEEEEEE